MTMPSPPTVLLLGGTGRTGLCALDQLTARGVRVRAIVRSPDKIPPAVQTRRTLELVQAGLLDLTDE